MKIFSATTAVTFAVLVAAATASFGFPSAPPLVTEKAFADQIQNLPDAPAVDFRQFSGYLNVNSENNRNLFYWFVESQNDPANDPVILWLNGGPGCSSLGGFLTENGPFWPTEEGQLSLNQFAWNKVANVLYIESPAGVGFSYSDKESDYTVGDARTADDTYIALQQFFDTYPHLRELPFWISGESYGGHYVPQAAARILKGNELSKKQINISGFLVGNAWTDAPVDNAWTVFYWWSHALISDDTYNGLMKHCDFTSIGPLLKSEENGVKYTEDDKKLCEQLQNTATAEMGNINIYDIYETVCTASTPSNSQGQTLLAHLALSESPLSQFAKYAVPSQHMLGDRKAAPCIDEWMTTYLNRDDVQEAIHANKFSYKWENCSPRVNYSYSDLLTPIVNLYTDVLIPSDLRVLVYSGDVDAIVPVTGTRAWMKKAKLKPVEKWRPWKVGTQVGGYVEEYEGFTFCTVRDAGHMVPGTQPERAFEMMKRWVSGDKL